MADRETRPLPDGWRAVPLGDVAEVVMGQSPPGNTVHDLNGQTDRSSGLPFAQGNAEFGSRSPTPVKWCVRPAKAALPSDLLISVRAPVGETNRADQALAIGRGLAAVRFMDADATYGWHILNHAKGAFDRLAQGSTFEAISGSDLRSLSLLLPPLPEQRAIAAVLDSIDEAIERTDEVISATDRLRDALLHELLTRGLPGHHTAWRDVPGLGTIPASWEVVRLGNVAASITSGSRAWSEHFAPEGALFVRSQNIVGGKVDRTDAILVHPPADAEAERTRIGLGDLLISITGEPGKVTVADSALGEAYVSQHVALVRLNQSHLSGFLATFLKGPLAQEHFRRSSYGQTRPGLNLSNVGSVRLALPPLPEQRAIAGALDSVDATIEGARAERAALQSSKASTADALLTGRVRVGDVGESTEHVAEG